MSDQQTYYIHIRKEEIISANQSHIKCHPFLGGRKHNLFIVNVRRLFTLV